MHDRLGVVPDFRNKEIAQHLLNFAEHSLAFSTCLSAPLRWCGTGWQALFYRAVFLFVVRSGQQPEIYDGCNGAQPAIIGIAAFVSGMFSRWLAKPSPSRHILSEIIRSCKTAEWLAFGGTENSAYSDSLRGGNAAVERMGIVRFLELAAKRRGAETLDI